MKQPERWMMPFLTGHCFDFALALAEKIDDAVFVAVGSARLPEHVGVRIGDMIADVRGLMTEAEFLTRMRQSPLEGPVIDIDRSVVELHAGVSGLEPPYKGVKEMGAARKAVKQAFPKGVPQPEYAPGLTI